MTFDEAFFQACRNLKMILPDDEQERARMIARDVAVMMLEGAATNIDKLVCKSCFQMSDADGLAAGELSAKLVRNVINQVKGD